MDRITPSNGTSSLEVASMDIANERYSDFVNVNQTELSQLQFKEAQNLPLNETIASVFFRKTSHLQDHDFIQIDRDMLQTIGFKNTFTHKKDSHGNLKFDRDGNPVMEDKRQDFNNAIKCLRNTAGFVEGTSIEDTDAHFVIQKIAHPIIGAIRGGQNRQELCVRMRALEHFIIMANTQNSFMIREYFLDLKRIMVEYNMYLAVYRSKKELCRKDCEISSLVEEMRSQREQMNEFMLQSKRTETEIKHQNVDMKHTLDRVLDTVTRIEDKVVLPAEDPKVKELLVIMHSPEHGRYVALRTQERNKREAIKQCKIRYGRHYDEAFDIVSYQNPRNLFHRFKDFVSGDVELRESVKFRRTTFETSIDIDDIKTMFLDLEKSFRESVGCL